MRWLVPVLLILQTACYRRPDVLPDPITELPYTVAVNACAPPREARVACTLDGDTLDLAACGDAGERVRLLGLDAPEIAHSPEPAECYGDRAAQALRELAYGKDVLISFDNTCVDVYSRSLAYVWILGETDEDDIDTGDEINEDPGLFVNEWLLDNGYARLYDEEWVDPLALQTRLNAAEASARARGIGLWAECGADPK